MTVIACRCPAGFRITEHGAKNGDAVPFHVFLGAKPSATTSQSKGTPPSLKSGFEPSLLVS